MRVFGVVCAAAILAVVVAAGIHGARGDERITLLKESHENATGSDLGTFPRERAEVQASFVAVSVIVTSLASLFASVVSDLLNSRSASAFDRSDREIAAVVLVLSLVALPLAFFAGALVTEITDALLALFPELGPLQLPYNSRLSAFLSVVVAIVTPFVYNASKRLLS